MEDVIVIGGGPAGNMAAIGLAELGHRVVVIDSRHCLGDKLCTGIIGKDCFDRFPPDEDDILGKTKKVFLKSPWCKKEKFRKMLYDIIQEFIDNKESIKKNVNNIFIKYDLELCDQFNNRLDNYKQIIENEL